MRESFVALFVITCAAAATEIEGLARPEATCWRGAPSMDVGLKETLCFLLGNDKECLVQV